MNNVEETVVAKETEETENVAVEKVTNGNETENEMESKMETAQDEENIVSNENGVVVEGVEEIVTMETDTGIEGGGVNGVENGDEDGDSNRENAENGIVRFVVC